MVGNLAKKLLDPQRRPTVVNDCVTLIETEVATKGGLGGMAIKGAFALVKNIRPGIIRSAVDKLLDEFVLGLDPFYCDFVAQSPNEEGASLETFFSGHADQVATALLAVTDEKAERAQNAPIRKAYGKLRPHGVKHVTDAVPGIARLIAKHT